MSYKALLPLFKQAKTAIEPCKRLICSEFANSNLWVNC